MEQHWYIENRKSKYEGKIKAERRNFLFLKDGTMVCPNTGEINGWVDALIDAVHHGEDLDDMISLIFPEKIDHAIVKEKIQKML